MPVPSTTQTQMKSHLGRVPALDANGFIDNISFKRNVISKVTDYTVLATDSGSLITSYGATADIEFTLPALADGLEFTFINCADIEMKISSAAGNDIVTFNDAAASSITFTTASKQLGAAITLVSDGTVWYSLMHAPNAGSLPTAAAIA